MVVIKSGILENSLSKPLIAKGDIIVKMEDIICVCAFFCFVMLCMKNDFLVSFYVFLLSFLVKISNILSSKTA